MLFKSFSLIILLFISTRLVSQTIKFRPLAGFNLANHSIKYPQNDKLNDERSKLGFDVGLDIEAKISSQSAVKVIWMYSHGGGTMTRLFYSLVSGSADYPFTKEEYTLNFIKLPILYVRYQQNSNPLVFEIGPCIKSSLLSNRDGMIQETPESYNSKYKLETKSGNKTGISLMAGIGKQFEMLTKEDRVTLLVDYDISSWRYQTNFEYEKVYYFGFRTFNISLMYSIGL